MSRTNPVYTVLVPNANQAILAAGNPVSALGDRQLGIFNAHSNLSLDAASPATEMEDIYIAMGLFLGTGALADIKKSAGHMIQRRHGVYLTYKAPAPAFPKIIELTNFTARCEESYAVKIENRNQKGYQLTGYNGTIETYAFKTGCCVDQCEGCGTGDGVELAKGLMDNVNADPEHLVVASLFANSITATVGDATADGTATYLLGGVHVITVAMLGADNATQTAAKVAAAINAHASGYKATSSVAALTVYPPSTVSGNTRTIALTSAGATGTTLTAITVANTNVTDSAVFAATYPGVVPGIRFTSQALALINDYSGNVDINYMNSASNDIIISLVEGFNCNGTLTTVQEAQAAEGLGNVLKYWENFAAGWGIRGPYRVSEVLGLERPGAQKLYVDPAAFYHTLVLDWDVESTAGFLHHKNPHSLILAIPCADTTTLAGLVAVTDVIFATKFGVMTNDISGMNCSSNNPGNTGDLLAATDGLELIAH